MYYAANHRTNYKLHPGERPRFFHYTSTSYLKGFLCDYYFISYFDEWGVIRKSACVFNKKLSFFYLLLFFLHLFGLQYVSFAYQEFLHVTFLMLLVQRRFVVLIAILALLNMYDCVESHKFRMANSFLDSPDEGIPT